MVNISKPNNMASVHKISTATYSPGYIPCTEPCNNHICTPGVWHPSLLLLAITDGWIPCCVVLLFHNHQGIETTKLNLIFLLYKHDLFMYIYIHICQSWCSVLHRVTQWNRAVSKPVLTQTACPKIVKHLICWASSPPKASCHMAKRLKYEHVCSPLWCSNQRNKWHAVSVDGFI